MTQTTTNKKRQWAWFVGLWLAGFCTLGVISVLIKAVMNIG